MTSVKSTSKKVAKTEKVVKNAPAGLGLGKNNSTQPPLNLRGGEGGVIKQGKGKIQNLNMPVYNQDGKEAGNVNLPSEIFGLKVNADLIAQAVRAQLTNSRESIAHAKDRSEVRGGGRKPWKQKGTGRARHSSIRSPLWAGGGVTFGPRKEKNFAVKINKKMKCQALFMALSGKLCDGELIILDDLKLKQAKTKEMAQVIKNIFGTVVSAREKSLTPVRIPSAMIILAKNDETVVRATKNLPKIRIIGVNSLNIVDLLSVKYLLMLKEAVGKTREIYKK